MEEKMVPLIKDKKSDDHHCPEDETKKVERQSSVMQLEIAPKRFEGQSAVLQLEIVTASPKMPEVKSKPTEHIIYSPGVMQREDYIHLDQKSESYQDEIYKFLL